MTPEIETRLANQEAKLDAILTSVQKTEKYFRATLWVTVVVFVLPLILMLFAVPAFIRTYTNTISGLGM